MIDSFAVILFFVNQRGVILFCSTRRKKMAYVNEKIPKEEIKEYIMPDYGKKMPYSRTIDKEKNMMILTYGRNIDEPSEEHFVLMKDEKIIFSAVLWQDVDENTVIWSMCGYKVWKECQFSLSPLCRIVQSRRYSAVPTRTIVAPLRAAIR